MSLKNGIYKTSVYKRGGWWVVSDYLPDATTSFRVWEHAIHFALNWRSA
jgi:hypothetical protein